jgi:VIT1/CCC1 family predicted Fe2+/Mn2+ transporter
MRDEEMDVPGTTSQREEQHPHGGEWLREIVFGLNDGLVTTLVFIMVVSNVAASHLVLIALGEVIAGGISMALGGFLSADTAVNIRDYRIATERHEIRHEPEEERAELRAIYRRKGFRGRLLDRVVDHLTSDEERWLQAMVSDELGVVGEEDRHPILQGVLVGLSFVAGGIIPVIPFLPPLSHPQVWAFVLTAVTALLFGGLKARYTLKGPLRAGLEFLAIVTLGSIAGVIVGMILHAV